MCGIQSLPLMPDMLKHFSAVADARFGSLFRRDSQARLSVLVSCIGACTTCPAYSKQSSPLLKLKWSIAVRNLTRSR